MHGTAIINNVTMLAPQQVTNPPLSQATLNRVKTKYTWEPMVMCGFMLDLIMSTDANPNPNRGRDSGNNHGHEHGPAHVSRRDGIGRDAMQTVGIKPTG